MIKRQNRTQKLFFIFLISSLSISFSAFCDTPKEKLILADSLFDQKKYTQSFELYNEIQKSNQKTSPAMLLKMAFIKEGLGDYTNALYYLNLYYLKTYNKKALKKMENLAEQNKLSGYNYDDVEFFLNLYYQYQLQIDLLVAGLMFMFFGILIYQKRTKKLSPGLPRVVYICLLLTLLIINNFARERTKAIVTASEAYLMKGPSPGADVVEVISQGHRVDILDQDDVWVKISWNEEDAYIKAFNLKPVKL